MKPTRLSISIGIALSFFGLAGCSEGAGGAASESAERGRIIASEKGCVNCHSADGSRSVGPTWKGLAGSKVELANGTTVQADDAYLRESMLDPSAKTVKGFNPGLMESVIEPDSLSQEEVRALIAYIKSLE